MVGEGDEAPQPENVFDLVSLRLISQLGGQWRRPVGGGQIDGDARSPVLTLEGPAQQGPAIGKFLYEAEALLRAVGMTVKRDRSVIVPGHIRRVPKAGKLGLRQSQFVLRPRSFAQLCHSLGLQSSECVRRLVTLELSAAITGH